MKPWLDNHISIRLLYMGSNKLVMQPERDGEGGSGVQPKIFEQLSEMVELALWVDNLHLRGNRRGKPITEQQLREKIQGEVSLE